MQFRVGHGPCRNSLPPVCKREYIVIKLSVLSYALKPTTNSSLRTRMTAFSSPRRSILLSSDGGPKATLVPMPPILVRLVFHPGCYPEKSRDVHGESAARDVVRCEFRIRIRHGCESVPPSRVSVFSAFISTAPVTL